MKKSLRSIMALFLVGCTVFAGCQNFDDLIPEEFGEWENNYIYRGNVRSKTTGEDWEYLVTEISDEDFTYQVQSCADYAILGDDIYMCLNFAYVDDGSSAFTSGIVKYNVQSKTQENVCISPEFATEGEPSSTKVSYYPYSIESLSENGLLLYGRKVSITYDENGAQNNYSNQTLHYVIDFEGNVVEEAAFNYTFFARVSDQYWSNTDYKDDKWCFYYVTWGMQEPVLVCEKSYAEYEFKTTFIEKNGAVGFLIESMKKQEDGANGNVLSKLEFYNIKSGTLTTLYEGGKYADWIDIPKNEYFVTYEHKTITYEYREGLFSPKKQEEVETNTDCVLYQIVYSENGAEIKTACDFGAKKDFTDIRAVANGKAYLHGTWYVEDAYGCMGGGMQQGYYEVELPSGEIDELEREELDAAEDEAFGHYARQTGVVCGNYVYYLQSEKLTTIGNTNSYAYLLKRYDTDEKKTDVMQLWHANYSQTGEKYCEEMWRRVGGDLEEFIVRNY